MTDAFKCCNMHLKCTAGLICPCKNKFLSILNPCLRSFHICEPAQIQNNGSCLNQILFFFVKIWTDTQAPQITCTWKYQGFIFGNPLLLPSHLIQCLIKCKGFHTSMPYPHSYITSSVTKNTVMLCLFTRLITYPRIGYVLFILCLY